MRIVAIRALAPVGAVFMSIGWAATASMRGPGRTVPWVMETAPLGLPLEDTFTVMTLNVAHGRCVGMHQLFTNNGTIASNLDRIAALIRREAPDVVALQEADGPSAWSGRFDHVEHLGAAAEMARGIRGEHMRGAGLVYGTALLANAEITEPVSMTFAPNPPTPAKGFVLATVAHPRSPTGGVDVVSVHLDFSRARVRRRQIDALIEALEGRPHPRVIMGDLNASWKERHTLPKLAAALGAEQVAPAKGAPPTYPSMGGNLDWIVVSPELEIIASKVVTDEIVSDHRPVVARLAFRSPTAKVAVDPRIKRPPALLTGPPQ